MKSYLHATTEAIKRNYRTAIITIIVLAMILPVLYYGVPWFGNSPDIYYVKAKVLQVQEGNLFTDPVSGRITMHPAIYHEVIAGLVFIGCDIDMALAIISILNVVLLVFFVYKIVRHLYDPVTAFISCLLISFVVEFMGSRNILLAASFNFSVAFFLWGLWFYIRSKDSLAKACLTSLLWGLAFIISPVYIFLLGLIFIRDFVRYRSPKRLVVMISTFLLAIIPFIIQMYTVYGRGRYYTTTFALWRGLPGIDWWKAVVHDFLSPGGQTIVSLATAIYVLILILGIWYAIRRKRVFWFLPLSIIAYIFTYYHFSSQYAIRIQLFFSIFWVAMVVHDIIPNKKERYIEIMALLFIVGYSIYNHYGVALDAYHRWSAGEELYRQIGSRLWNNLDKYLDDNEFIFCTKDTYFRFIMTQKPIHALGAYKTMDYYQLDSLVSDTLESDYRTLINSWDYNIIKGLAAKYNVRTAIASSRDYGLPLFQTLSKYWKPVYRDEFFTIYRE